MTPTNLASRARPCRPFPLLRLTGALFLSLGCLALHAAEELRRAFNVPAGEAIETLPNAARQAGREIVFPAETVRGVRTQEVKGEYAPREAIERMLAGTDLRVQQDARSGALTVQRVPSETIVAQTTTPATLATPRERAGEADETVELESFVISTEKDIGYRSTHTAALRLNTPLKNLPLPVTVLNEEYLSDLNRDNMRDFLFYTAAYNADQGGSMRGLGADAGESATRNNSGYRGYQDAASIERVEILKGPAGLIYGLSQPGGRVNVFGLKAGFRDYNRVSVQVGSYDSRRGIIDLNRAFGNRLALRAQAMYRHEGQAQDNAYAVTRSYNFNALYRPWAKTEFELDWHHVNRDEQGFSRSISGYSLVNIDRSTANSARVPFATLYGAPLSFNSNSDEIPSIQDLTIPTFTWRQEWFENFETLAQVNHQWRWQHNLAGDTAVTHSPTAPIFTSDWESRGGDAVRSWDLQLQAAYRFTTGPLTHKLSAYGVQNYAYTDFIRYYDAQVESDGRLKLNSNSTQTLRRSRTTPIPVGNFGAYQPLRIPSDLRLEFFDSQRNGNTKGQVANLLYQGDLKTGIGEFNGLVGVNYVKSEANGPATNITGYTVRQTGITPTNTLEPNSASRWSGGLVYAPLSYLQVYAANTRAVPSITIQRNSFSQILPLESSENKELGFRLQLLDEAISITAAYFDTVVANRIVTDPSLINNSTQDDKDRTALQPGFDPTKLKPNTSLGDRVSAGEYSSEGFELEVNLALGRNTVVKLEYIDVDAAVSADPNRSRIGLRDNGFTPRTFTAIGKYLFSSGPLKGLWLGSGLRLSDDRFLREDLGSVVGVRDLWRPGVRQLDLFGGYNFRVGERYAVALQLNVDNVNRDSRYEGVRAVSLEPYEFTRPTVWRLNLQVEF